MRILIDECVNPRLRQAFAGHQVQTVAEADWRALPDSSLVAHAQGKCDVLVTIDRGFEHQHNLKTLTFGIVIVHVRRNRMEYYCPLFQAIFEACEQVMPGEVRHVGRA